jgi:hypothetical protein
MRVVSLLSLRANFFLALSITFLCFLATYFFLGFYYTDYQGFASGLFSGKLTPGVPFRSLYFIANFKIAYLYSYLYQFFPGVEWLSWIYCTFSFLACFIGLFIVSELLPVNTSIKVKSAILVAVYYMVFADNHIHFICSHISFMTCGLSLVGLVYFFKSKGAVTARWPLFLALNLLFTLGTLTRVETGTACVMLIIFFSAFYIQNFKQCILLLLYPLVLVASLSLAISLDIKNSSEFYLQIEPDIEAQFENRDNKVPLSFMKTHRDTVMYKTASDIMWSDPQVITPKFLRSLILPEKLMFTDGKQWKRVFTNISEMLSKYWYLVAINLLLALAIFFQYPFRKSTLRWLYWLAFEASFWALIVAQTYVYKLNDRSFTPYISLFIFCHIVILIANLGPRISGWLYLISPFILILFISQFYHLVLEAGYLRKDLVIYQSNFEKIKKVAQGRFLVINAPAADYICLSNVPFRPFDFSFFKRVYVTDGSVVPFIPYYRRFLEQECKCDMYAYPGFYDYLKSIHTQVVIVSSSQRIEVIRNYLQEVYHYDLPVREIDTVSLLEAQKDDSRDYFEELKMYRLQ